MKDELIQMLNKWKQERFYQFEDRNYAGKPNPYSEGEWIIKLWHTATIKDGKKSSPFGSETLFFTFAQNDRSGIPGSGDVIRLEREIQLLGSHFDKKVKKFFELEYKKFEKKVAK